jgi:Ca2+-binding RTX toxin-like protein
VVVTPAGDPGSTLAVQQEVPGTGEGADRLIGGPGPDLLVGGGGPDLFGFQSADDGVDRILDFDARAGDALDLSELLGGSAPADLNERVVLSAIDADGAGRADDIQLAVDPDGAGPVAPAVLAVLVDPVGLAAGMRAQDLVDAGNLVV